ncbi:hypothetical protein KBD49_09905 [Myxococcota bacterium]|nr:hypothetical protein [Myxococcota bacterium]
MPLRSILPAILFAMIGTVASRAAWGDTAPVEYSIPPGQEDLLLRMTRPGPRGFPGGYLLQEVRVDRNTAALSYRSRAGRSLQILLVHPSRAESPLARTEKFAIVSPEGPANPSAGRLVRALARQVRKHESAFAWSASGSGESPSPPPKDPALGAPPGMWMPEIPENGLSIAFLGPPRHQVAAEALPEYQSVKEAAAQGPAPEAIARAVALARKHSGHAPTVRAVASLIRSAGDGAKARDLLRPLLATPVEQTPGDLLTEHLASLELAGDGQALGEICGRVASAAKTPGSQPSCCRIAAWTLLLREGRTQEVARAVGPLDAPVSSLCEAVIRLRLAIHLDDPAAVEKAGKAATDAFPKDPDLWFLWGNYYWNRRELDKAMAPWDHLMALKPDYPSALGLYISTYLMSGRLGQDTIPQWSRKADAAPDDPVVNYLAAISWYYKANSTHDPEDYRRSIPYFERVVARIPKDQPRAWMYLGMAHFFTGNQQRAEQILQDLEPYTWHEPDINYCRSLVYRKTDLPRAIAEMERFLQVFLMEGRLNFGPAKLKKAQDDLEAMKRGEIPSYWLPPDAQ